MTGMNINNAMSAYQTQTDISAKQSANAKAGEFDTKPTSVEQTKTNYGKTVGEPKLSEKAQKYYEQLKKKFGQYDFILVSSAEKDNVKANAGKYANSLKTVVLIGEDEIEKMVTDEKVRKQYEGILSGATKQIEQIKAAAQSAGANLQGVVMQVNEDGSTSFFAAVKKSLDIQKDRIEKHAAQKKVNEKNEEKKAEKKKQQEKLNEKLESNSDLKGSDVKGEDDEIVTFMADSFESLIKKIQDFSFDERSNSVQTESEMMVGQNIDFRG